MGSEEPPFGGREAPLEADWGLEAMGIANVFNKALSLTAGPQGPGRGLQETVQSSPYVSA